MRTITRHAPNDARRPRNTLSLRTWRGQDCSKLAAGEQTDDTDTDAAAQLFADWLTIERNRWDIHRRQGGGGLFASHRRWDRRDAERAWQAMFGKRRENA